MANDKGQSAEEAVVDAMFAARRMIRPDLRNALAQLDLASEGFTAMVQLAILNLALLVDRDLLRRGIEAVFAMDDVMIGPDYVRGRFRG